MYPYIVIDFGEHFRLGLYDICLMVGIIACLALYRIFADRQKFKAKIQNFALFTGLIAIGCGYYAAALVQTFYNWKDALGTEKEADFWSFWGTGATFYGGLVGGVIIFLIIYFGIGALIFKKQENIHHFFPIASIAGAVIPVAHGIGRIGCLMAGCCHGTRCEAPLWYTLTFYENIVKQSDGTVTADAFYAVPVQLYEAIFLLALAVFLIWRVIKNKHYNLSIYTISYGVWRFLAEYLRGDARGEGIVSFLSPSQQTALLLIAVGIGVIFAEKYTRRYTARVMAAQVSEVPAKEVQEPHEQASPEP